MADYADMIRDLERHRIDAMSSADESRLRALIKPTCSYVHSSGRIDTGTSYIDQLVGGGFGYESIEVNEQSVSVTNAVAVVVFRQIARMRIGNERHTAITRCTAIWADDGRNIQLVAFAATPIR